MSGAEAIAVLGVIGSIISIIDGTQKVYDAATNARGLPVAFREVADKLPIVCLILDTAKQNIGEDKVDNDSYEKVERVARDCEEKAKKLAELFDKAIPKEGASDLARYYNAVRALGRGGKVENLMKGVLEDVQLLACEHGMKTATKAQQGQILKAIAEVSAVSPSVPENEFQETGFTNNNYGSGSQYNAQGENIAQGSARQYMSAGGTMNFGKD